MNTVFDTDSDASVNSVTFNFPDFASPEITFSITASPELAFSSPDADSSDDNESIVIPFSDDDNVSAPQPQPAQLQPRTIPVEKWTHLIHDSPEAASSFNAASSGTTSSPEITFSITASPEPASLDDNESIVIPFPDDDNVSAPQLQPVQSYPAQPQPRTIPVEEWTHLIHDSPEECIRCCKAGENKQYVRRSYRPRKASNWIFLYRIQRNEGNG